MTKMYGEAMRCIHQGVNPYDGFPVEKWQPDYFGFFDPDNDGGKMMLETLERWRPTLYLEVGSYLGKSARWAAQWMKDHEIDGCVVSTDTWLHEYILWTIPEHRDHMKLINGKPHSYEVFMRTVLDAGLQDYICPLPMDSRGAMRYLIALKFKFQVIYIDGSHEKGDVWADLFLAWHLLQPGGALIVDDYNFSSPMFTGLIEDVDAFVAQNKLSMEVRGLKARIIGPAVEAK